MEGLKWFEKDAEGKNYITVKKVKNLKEAWEKTLEKWNLKSLPEMPRTWSLPPAEHTCGLCEIFGECEDCLISKFTGEPDCYETPYCQDDPEWELTYLLMLKEMTK